MVMENPVGPATPEPVLLVAVTLIVNVPLTLGIPPRDPLEENVIPAGRPVALHEHPEHVPFASPVALN